MSTQDDSAFDDYLQGKSSVSAQYRQLRHDQLQHEEVPPALDQQVLQQARAALQPPAANEPSFWARWNKPLAMAASLLVITSVVIKLVQQSHIEPQFTQESPAVETKTMEETAPPALAIPEAALSSKQEATTVATTRDEAAARRQAQPAALADAARGGSAAEVIAPPPALNLPMVAAPSAPVPAETSAERREQDNTARSDALQKVATPMAVTAERPAAAAPARNMGPAQAPVASVGAVSLNVLRTDEELTNDPVRWLQTIRELRAQNKSVEADAAWAQFRKAWPEYVVSADDKARPASP